MANVWVGTDYYIPSIDSSGTTYSIEVNSTTTSNTYTCLFDKDSILANVASVGATENVWFEDSFYTDCDSKWRFPATDNDNRRIEITPSSTTSDNGEGLVLELGISRYGKLLDLDPDHPSSLKPWAILAGGIGYTEQDGITFSNIYSGEKPDGTTVTNTWTGTIAITDKDLGVSLPTNSTDAQVAANTLPYINVLISTNTWTP